MTENGRDRSARPHRPLSEEDVLAVVEQVADPSETIGASRDPRLAARVREMRLDRDALISLGEAQAPRDLLVAAMDEADAETARALLADLSASAAGAGSAGPRRMASSRPVADRLIDTVFDRPARWLVAAAATLLLVLGSVAFLVAGALDGDDVESVIPTELAAADAPVVDQIDSSVGETASGAPLSPGSAGVAVAADDDPRAIGATPVAPADPPALALVTLESPADAAAALAEGRLIARVFHPSAERAEAALSAMQDGENRRASWRLEPARAAVVAAVEALGDGDRRAVLAGVVDPAGGDRGQAWRVDRLGVYTVAAPAKATALAAWRAALVDAGFEVTFVRLPAAMPVDAAFSAADVAWWNRPPTQWPEARMMPVIADVAIGPAAP